MFIPVFINRMFTENTLLTLESGAVIILKPRCGSETSKTKGKPNQARMNFAGW